MKGRYISLIFSEQVSADVWVWCKEDTTQGDIFCTAIKKLKNALENDDREILIDYGEMLERVEDERTLQQKKEKT